MTESRLQPRCKRGLLFGARFDEICSAFSQPSLGALLLFEAPASAHDRGELVALLRQPVHERTEARLALDAGQVRVRDEGIDVRESLSRAVRSSQSMARSRRFITA